MIRHFVEKKEGRQAFRPPAMKMIKNSSVSEIDLMDTKLDELEWTNKTLRILNDGGIWTIGGLLDYMDEGKNIGGLPKVTEKSVEEVYDGLKKLEWDGSQLKEDLEES